ncbi:MAG: hypothetical protein DHS20C19_05410 [Acidimicrobiales bacterium]|nr:MAG: hypothetical protein DHS20C19_05410 [Acidimicrobiales bacterium]
MVEAMSDARSVTERYCTAWLEGDLETLLDCYGDDIVLHYFGANQLSGDHVGKDAAIAALVAGATITTRELLSVDDIMVGDGTSTIVATERFTRDDESHVLTRVLRYRIEHGRFVECWLYDEDQALVDHLWR